MKCSYKTVQRAIDRLGLTRVDAIEKVEFEQNRVYAHYPKNRRTKKVGQHSPNTSFQLLSYMGKPIPGGGTPALEDTVYAEGTTQKICLMTDTEDNRKAFMASIQSGRNAICIGGPGTGKSYLMTKFVETHTGVLVMAPSGAAADRVNGMTIHHAFHLRQGCYGSDTPVTEDEIAALSGINCICIDEVGNLRRNIFHHIMNIISSAEDAFKKHIQILLFGDFDQLKPVCTSTDKAQLTRLWGQWKDSTILSDHDTLERLNLMATFTNMELTECKWLTHDGQAPDEE